MDYCLDGIERSRRSRVAKAPMVSSVELQKGFPAGHIPSLPVRASSKGRAVASKEDFDRPDQSCLGPYPGFRPRVAIRAPSQRLRPPLQACFDQTAHRLAAGNPDFCGVDIEGLN
jgi:hypothetical protein